MADSAPPPRVELAALAELFYPRLDALGNFSEVSAETIPEPYRRLLAHEEHMTVTVEAFHGGPVDVEVVERHDVSPQYARKILLRRQRDRRVVQFGIVRIHFRFLDERTQAEIREERTPLGRILIEHNILRQVRLLQLWRVEPAADLTRLFELPAAATTYGRTALIECNSEPAIELIEIVAPAEKSFGSRPLDG